MLGKLNTMKTNINSRDFLFILLGSIVTLLIGGFIKVRLDDESRKAAVHNWINGNAEIIEHAKENGYRIMTNTGYPGTIWLSFDQGKYSDELLWELSFRQKK